MPGDMDGLQLAAVIRDRWPPVELLVTSGHVSVEDGQLPERGRFLPKPYSPQQLTRALETLQLPAKSR
jgi:CheY-like chemotaxis protein